MSERICYHSIGIVRSPFTEQQGTPIQPHAAAGSEGSVEILPEYEECLKDIEGFSHIILLYHLHLSKPYSPLVKPYLDNELHGVFATRAPARPNPIGFSVVRLVRREGRLLILGEIDILDGTPLLDIKPYVPFFDDRDAERVGWLEGRKERSRKKKADSRFSS